MALEPLMTLKEVSEYTGMSRSYWLREARKGCLPGCKRLRFGKNSKFVVNRSTFLNWYRLPTEAQRKGRTAAHRKIPTVYVMRCEQFIKIGWTTNVSLRLKHLSTSNPFPITLLGQAEADRGCEMELHEMFREFRSTGEWFELPEGELEALKQWIVQRDGQWETA